jgi:hypothetical protein
MATIMTISSFTHTEEEYIGTPHFVTKMRKLALLRQSFSWRYKMALVSSVEKNE